MKQLAAVLGLILLLGAVPAEAGQGRGRVSVLPGWRFGLNGRFYGRAAEDGYRPDKTLNGGPSLLTSFAYAATEIFELSIDPFVAFEQLRLVDVPALNAWIYGALVTARLQVEPSLFGGRVTLAAGLSSGGLLVNVSGGGQPGLESFAPAYGASAGVTVALTDTFGISAEYKVVFADGAGTVYGEARGNGHFVGLGLTWFFADTGGRPLSSLSGQ